MRETLKTRFHQLMIARAQDLKDFNFVALRSIFVFQNYSMPIVELVQWFPTGEKFRSRRISTHLGKAFPHFKVYTISILLHLVDHLHFRIFP